MKQYQGNYIYLFAILGLAILFFAQPFISVVFAYGVLTLDASIDGTSSTVETGEIVTYILDFSCGGVTGDCGTLSIDFTLDPDTEFIEVIPSTGYTASESGGVVTIVDQDGNFEDGDSSQAVVRVRVRHDLLGTETIQPTLEGTIGFGQPGDIPLTIDQGVPSINVDAPTEQWSVNKVQTTPPSGIGPAEDGTATFEVQFCSDSATGNFSLNNAQLIDTFPDGAIVVGNPDGGTVIPGPPPQISWLLGTLDVATLGTNCITRSYTLQYPVGTFPVGTSIPNSVQGLGENLDFPITGPCGINCIGDTSTSGTIDSPTVDPGPAKVGPGNSIVSPDGGISDFFLSFNLTNANAPAEGLIFTDTLPLAPSDNIPPISVMEIQSGTWAGGFQAVVEWQDSVGTWTPIGTVDGTANTSFLSGQGIGDDFPVPEQDFSTNTTTNIIYGVRWRFTDPELPAQFTLTSTPVVSFIPREGMAPGDYDAGGGFRDYANCLNVTYGVDGNPPTTTPDTCANVRLSDEPQGFANILWSKLDSPNEVDVLQPLTFTLSIELTQEASGDLVNPTIIDLIPPYLDYNPADGFTVTFTNVPPLEQIEPYLAIQTTVSGTELVFYWDNLAPRPNSFDSSGTLVPTIIANNNDLTLTDPAVGSKRIDIAFTVIPDLTAPAGSWPNDVTIVSDSPSLFCQSGTTTLDTDDIDSDSDDTETACGTTTNYVVREAAQMISQKWIRSIAGPFTFRDSNNISNPTPVCPTYTFAGNTYTRFPCVAQGIQGGDFETLLRIQNTGLTGTNEYILYDVLPHIGDTGVSEATSGIDRLTEFVSVMTGPVVIASLPTGLTAGDFTIEYNTSPAYNGCRREMSNDDIETDDFPVPCNDTWVSAATIGANWDTVTSFRIVQDSGQINADGVLLFTVPMLIPPYSAPFDEADAETGEITWNQFAQRFSNAGSGSRLLTAEPRKVGIIVVQEFSIGNIVFEDSGVGGGTINNGIRDGAEPGIPNITMQLFIDTNNNNVFNPGTDTLVNTDLTDANGFYLFESDSSNNPLVEGARYFVRIAPAEFFEDGDGIMEPGVDDGDLVRYIGSTPQFTNNVDSNDNGNNGFDPTTNPNPNYPVNGIVSNGVRMIRNGFPTGETELSGDALDGPEFRGNRFQEDQDSNLTIDFGVFMPFSIGNHVWRDNGIGAGGVRLDGMRNGTEAGIASVDLSLFLDSNANNTFDLGTDTLVTTTTTDTNGYYVFDAISAGTYFVWIDDTNFQTGGNLALLENSPDDGIGGGDDQIDLDDNGIDDDFPAVNGIVSSPIVLSLANEPLNEADTSGNTTDHGTNFRGLSNPSDDNSDLTIDFGFDVPRMSLGNRVWFDTNNSATDDAGDIPYGSNPTIGISGVRVDLYLDSNNDGIAQVGEIIASDTTDANGYYLFSDLAPGFYFVGLNELNFRTGFVLEDLYSSTGNSPDNQTDIDDNGIDDATPETGGIISPRIELGTNATRNTEPINEPDPSNNGLDGPEFRGNNDEMDSNSDLTIDFGLYKPMSLGNRVWFDPDVNGVIDFATENGIGAVTVELYLDDGDGVFDAGLDTLLDSDTTDAEGFYLFDDPLIMEPGDYFVYIPPVNFNGGGSLVNLLSTTTTLDDVDNNDNGVDDADPATNGIVSNLVTLSVDGQPVGESNFSNNVGDGPNRIGNNGQVDNNSDISIDFGFFGSRMSLGNRVWFDPNNSGDIDGAEAGIAGVTVTLYRDTNGDGIPNGAAIGTDITDANGYYLFGNLAPGNYVVALGNANFQAGNPLVGLISSTGNGVDDQTDSDDNGIDALNATFGLLSPTINLALDSEIDTEADLGPEGDGPNGETPLNSELTIDFGLYRPMSIGNRVWLDPDNNGQINAGEIGIGNVIVNLYRDDNNDGLIDPTELLGTDTTDANGFYLFDGLGEGNYIVEIEPSNFNGTGALLSLSSSTNHLTTDADSRDKGIDDADPATNGILSSVFTLTLNTEPTTDTNLGPDGLGSNGETNPNSNLSVDFGFFGLPMSLGNRVWFDDGAGGGNARDGIKDATELGVAGARVSLYFDSDQDGVPDGAAIATDTTDANGYYLFDGLQAGFYVVGIDAFNFGATRVLDGFSSTTTLAPDVDNNDNGIDNNNPAVNGIFSDTVQLQLTTEPLTDTDLGPEGLGANGETDDNSNLTVDFGFYKPMSLGNRVWFDPNDNSLIDGSEVGIAGVTVTLYLDSNADGVPDIGEEVGTDTTDSNGYYLFDDLDPGDYIVVVDATNFTTGVLQGFASSTGVATDPDVTDSNDNGIDTPTAVGIASNVVTLTLNSAPTNDTDTSGDTADGPNFRGNNGESNNNSDLSIDFGFVTGVMSIGNRVWFDTNDNGLIDGGELGVENVVVNLYADVNQDGVPDGAIIRSDTTDATGYYIFDGLPPGSYLVQVAPANFQSGNPLQSLFSSSVTDNSVGVDNNDNGIDSPTPLTTGIFSDTVILVANTAPVTEDPADYGPEGDGRNGETPDNSDLTIDFGFATRFDLGDAPDSYLTLAGSGGPRHQIVSDLYLGEVVDDENDGQPNVGADGDDSNGTASDDEDGVNIPTLVAGTNISLDFTVFNDTGVIANLIAWFDFDGNGQFDPSEAFSTTVPSNSAEQIIPLTIMVPISADQTTGGSTYARIRLTTDAIGSGDPGGLANDGEIEDYVVTIDPPGIAMTKTDGNNSIVVGQATTYTITLTNSGVDIFNRNFVDNLPTGDPNGFIASSISWTCTATNGASCISGQPGGTDDSGIGNINTFIDIPRDGTIVYELTATLNEDYNDVEVINIAQLISGTQVQDVNGIIYDPPSGVKSGVLLDSNHIRWTMVWLNTGAPQAATITDTLPSNQTFDGNLSCNDFGPDSSTSSCIFNGSDIVWTGIIGTGNANRIEIVFDVFISGDGIYRNTAEIDIGGATASASARIRIGDGSDDDDEDGSSSGDGGSGSTIIAPALSKVVDTPFTLPGSTVTWTIQAFNDTNQTITNVIVTDNVPDTLEILSGNSTSGDLEINGQTVTARQASLAPGESISIILRTRVSRDIGLPFVVNNPATLTCDCSESRDAIATIISVLELPATGQSPYSGGRFSIPLILIALAGLGWTIYRRRSPIKSE